MGNKIIMINKSHFQDKEPILEGILSNFRFNKIGKYIPENSKVLDLGCGFNGFFLQKNKNKIGEGFGVDISVNTDYSDSKIKLISHNINENIPFKDGFFDVVVSLANLEHLDSPENNLREIFRVLKPRGVLLLTTPSIYAKPVLEFLSFRLKLVNMEEMRDHKNYFNREKLSEMLKIAGFSFIEHHYFQLFMNNFIYARK